MNPYVSWKSFVQGREIRPFLTRSLKAYRAWIVSWTPCSENADSGSTETDLKMDSAKSFPSPCTVEERVLKEVADSESRVTAKVCRKSAGKGS